MGRRNGVEALDGLEIIGKAESGDMSDFGVYLMMDDVEQNSCAGIVAWILSENLQPKRKRHLTLIICSPGGDLNACFAVVDAMRGSAIPIRTVGLGQIASAGLVMFLAGEKGHRVLTPNTSILSHQFSWGSGGKEHELFAAQREYDLTSKRLLRHYMWATGLSEEQIRKVLLPPHDVWLSAEEALKYGICDQIRLVGSGAEPVPAPEQKPRRVKKAK